MNRPLSIAELAALAADTDDQSVTQAAGDFEREIIPEGPNFARFVEYIETGKHPVKAYQGKEKPPAELIRLTFELLHPKKSIIEYEQDGVTKKRGQLITIRVKKSLSDKASFKKVLNAMLYGRDNIKHFAQMLGEPFLVNVFHNKDKDASGKEVIYANLSNSDGVFSIGAPSVVDPITGNVTDLIPHIPMPMAPIRIFLWNNPTKETWDSLFIDGTREVKDAAGKITIESKNWLQENMMSALNFEGSALHSMLHGVADLPLSESSAPAVQDTPAASPVSAGTAAATSNAAPITTGTLDMLPGEPEKPAEAKPVDQAAAPASSANDALAALGLV